MKFLKESKPSRKHLVEITVIIAVSIILLNPLNLSLSIGSLNISPEAVRAIILELGVIAPLGMIFFEWLQVVIAPLPAVTMLASGYTFGTFHGSIYSIIGVTLGMATIMLLTRKHGKPLVEKFVSEEHMEKFNHLTEKHGLVVFAVLFLLPGFPKDPLTYLAGLTELPLEKLFAVAVVARTPAVLALVFTGNNIATANLKLLTGLIAGFIAISILTVKYEEKIIETAVRWEREIMAWAI